MTKNILILLTSLFAVALFSGCATWDGVKKDSSNAWEATKEASQNAYEATKEAVSK